MLKKSNRDMNWTNGPMDCWSIFAVLFGPFFGPFAETFLIEILREEWLVFFFQASERAGILNPRI